MFKVELLKLAKSVKKLKEYEVDRILRESGQEVTRLPPYHCQFNATFTSVKMVAATKKCSNVGACVKFVHS